MIGDTDFNVSKLYDMLPASTSGDPLTRTPADNQTVRNVFVIGPDKKIKLVLVYPMTTGRNFQEILRVDRLAADDREASRRDAGRLETGRRRHHRGLRHRRRGQDDLSAGLEIAEAIYPDRAAAEVTAQVTIERSHRAFPGAQLRTWGQGSRVWCQRVSSPRDRIHILRRLTSNTAAAQAVMPAIAIASSRSPNST